jgi:hypothetical protein
VDANWTVLASYADHSSAEIVAGLLESEGISSRLTPNSAIPGLNAPCQILVPTDLIHRARRLLNEDPPSEAELESLAMRELPEDGGDP